jgi:lambda repressor-like predicted transcriptional regulator
MPRKQKSVSRKQINTLKTNFQEKNERNRAVCSYLSRRGFFVPDIRRALLALNGIQAKDLAELAGVSRPAVTNTLKGVRSNPKVMETMARILGLEQEEIW